MWRPLENVPLEQRIVMLEEIAENERDLSEYMRLKREILELQQQAHKQREHKQ